MSTQLLITQVVLTHTQTPAHTHYSQYTWSQLHELVAKIVECCQNPRKHHLAVFDKYQEKKYKRCSLVTESKLRERDFKLPPRNSGRESSMGGQGTGSIWRGFRG